MPPTLAYPATLCAVLRDQTSVDAVEMFDRASLRECESNEDMLRLVPDIKGGLAAGLRAARPRVGLDEGRQRGGPTGLCLQAPTPWLRRC